jgi:hypothetical protein
MGVSSAAVLLSILGGARAEARLSFSALDFSAPGLTMTCLSSTSESPQSLPPDGPHNHKGYRRARTLHGRDCTDVHGHLHGLHGHARMSCAQTIIVFTKPLTALFQAQYINHLYTVR